MAFSVATLPVPIAVAFSPAIRQVAAPVPEEHERVLPAAVVAVPAVMERLEICAGK